MVSARTKSKPRDILLSASLLLVVLLLLMVCLEISLRWFRPQLQINKVPSGWYVKHPRLKFFQTANFIGTMTTSEFENHFTINSLGLRDGEVSEKTPGTFRLLALGDSFTWGVGANQNETFPAVLEELLNRAGSEYRFEVINGGICRYFPFLEKVLFEEIGGKLEPDLLLLSILPNDVWDTMTGIDAIAVSEDGYLVKSLKGSVRLARKFGMRVPEPFSLSGFLKLHSHLYVLVTNRLALLKGHRSIGEMDRGSGTFSTYSEPLHKLLSQVKAIAELCHKSKMSLVVVLIPQHERFIENHRRLEFYKYFEKEVESFCASSGIPCYNTYSALAKNPGMSGLYWKIDGHPKPGGYRAISEAVAAFLIESQFVPNQ